MLPWKAIWRFLSSLFEFFLFIYIPSKLRIWLASPKDGCVVASNKRDLSDCFKFKQPTKMNNSSESVNITQASPLVCPSDQEPVAISWIKTVVYLMLLCLALFGNALVIWIVYKHKRMHTAPNFLIVNFFLWDMRHIYYHSFCHLKVDNVYKIGETIF